VGEAVRLTGAAQLDVSSGVEAGPGRKEPRLIEAFVRAAHDAESETVGVRG
jgi:phosphoribosylanthranilate isomerase